MPSVSGLLLSSWGLLQRQELLAWSDGEKTLLFLFITLFLGTGLFPATAMNLLFWSVWGFSGIFYAVLSYFIALLIASLLKKIFSNTNIENLYPETEIYLTALRKRSKRLTFLLRLSPVLPFPAMNYLLLKSGIPISDYFLMSMLGMLPRLLITFMLGKALYESAEQASLSAGNALLLAVSIVSLCLLWFEGKKINNAIRKANR